jgi:hypothetical protein
MQRYFNDRRNSTNAQTADNTPTASAVAVVLQPIAPLTPTKKTLPENTTNNETKAWRQINLRVTPCTLCPCGHRRNPIRISCVETTSLHSVQMNRRSSQRRSNFPNPTVNLFFFIMRQKPPTFTSTSTSTPKSTRRSDRRDIGCHCQRCQNPGGIQSTTGEHLSPDRLRGSDHPRLSCYSQNTSISKQSLARPRRTQ